MFMHSSQTLSVWYDLSWLMEVYNINAEATYTSLFSLTTSPHVLLLLCLHTVNGLGYFK